MSVGPTFELFAFLAPLREDLSDLIVEFIDVKGLVDVLVCAEEGAREFVDRGANASEHDHANMIEFRLRTNVFADLPPVELWHHDVEYDEVWLLDDHELERLGAVVRLDDVAGEVVEVGSQQIPEVRIVGRPA